MFSFQDLLTKIGDFEWTKVTGMLSIWILGQFILSDINTIIIPYKQSESTKINNSYFGNIEADRLKVTEKPFSIKAILIN